MKVLLNSFHLNGHTLEPHLLTQGLALGVTGLTVRPYTERETYDKSKPPQDNSTHRKIPCYID